jgi:MFS family permease
LFSGLLPLFILAHFGHHLLNALPIPLLPFIREEFALDYTQAGLILSAFNITYGISQLPAGWLADRIGARPIIAIGICGVALCGLLLGLSPTYLMMIVFIIIMGILGGGYHPTSPSLISAFVKPKNRGRALGLHMIGGSASYFLAPLIAATIAASWGWRAPFITLAIPTILFGIAFYFLLGKRLGPGNKEITPKSHSSQMPPSLNWRYLAPFILLITSTVAIILSVIPYIPLYLVDHFKMEKEAAAAFIAVFYSAGLWAGPLGGYLSDHVGRRRIILSACFMAGPAIYLLSLMPFGLGFGLTLLFIGMTVYTIEPAAQAYIVSHTSERRRSSIFGIYFSAGLVGSGLIIPLLGYLITKFGFGTSFTIMGAALLAIALSYSLWLWVSRGQPSATEV